MTTIDSREDARDVSVGQPEYSGDHAVRHRLRGTHVSGRTLRLTYFGLASLWGFVVGVSGMLGAIQSEGLSRIPSSGSLAIYVLGGLAIAVVGSMIIAGAYQETKRRR